MNAMSKTARSSQMAKAEATTTAARSIIGAETAEREQKTERLRQLRLAMEAAKPEQPIAVKPRRAPAKKPALTRKKAAPPKPSS